MRNLIYLLVVAAPSLCCSLARSESTNTPLSFYIVSEAKVDGGRFIETASLPKLGYIAAKPDLVLTNLQNVNGQKSAPYSVMVGHNGNRKIVKNAPRSSLALTLEPADVKPFAAVTQRAVGKRLLIMLGDKPLTAPIVMAPIETGSISIEFGSEFGDRAEVKKTEDDLKRLVREKSP